MSQCLRGTTDEHTKEVTVQAGCAANERLEPEKGKCWWVVVPTPLEVCTTYRN